MKIVRALVAKQSSRGSQAIDCFRCFATRRAKRWRPLSTSSNRPFEEVTGGLLSRAFYDTEPDQQSAFAGVAADSLNVGLEAVHASRAYFVPFAERP